MSNAALADIAWTTQLLKIALLVTTLLPFLYLVYRVRGRNRADTAIYVGFLALYLLVQGGYLFGKYYTFHDARAAHIFYAITKQYVSLGDPGGWNPFLNGGEPFYLYSNYFLSADFIGLVLLNAVFRLSANDLMSVYFVFVILSYVTFAFVFFSVLFRERLTVFFCTAALLFGGLTANVAGQIHLLPDYFVPLAALSLYLFATRREWFWLAWAVFFLAVTGNRYFPHYLAFFMLVWMCGWWVAKYLAKKEPLLPRPKMTRAPYLAVALVLSVLALLPAMYVFRYFSANCISPTRGNAPLSTRQDATQPCVSISLSQYKYLLYIPQGQSLQPFEDFQDDDPAGKAAGESLQYVHGPPYVGIVVVLLALWAIIKCRKRAHVAFLIALIVLITMAVGRGSLLWLFFRYYVPLFYIRHSFFFGTIIGFVIVVIAGFGFALLKWDRRIRWGLIALVIAMGMGMSCYGRNYVKVPPPVPAPFAYPLERQFQLSEHLTKQIPFDINPLLLKKAVATYPDETFIFMRAKGYYALLQQYPMLTAGPLFAFSDRFLGMEDVGRGQIVLLKPTFERWWLQGKGGLVPYGWVLSGDSLNVDLRPGNLPGEARNGHIPLWMANVPDKAEIRLTTFVAGKLVAGKPVSFSAWVKSENRRAQCVQIEATDGIGPWQRAFYRNSGEWERLHVTLVVSPQCQTLTLRCRVLDNSDSPAYFDDPQLIEEKEDVLSPLPFRYMESSNPDRLTVEVDPPREGYVIRRENFHPDWSATLDGKPVAIEKFAGTFQAIKVASGKHVLDFRFRSPYAALFWTHVAAALLGQVIFFVCLVRWNDAEGKLAGHST